MSLRPFVTRLASAANRGIYRATRGRLAGLIKGAPILLLTTKGRKSGKRRTMRLLYLRDDGRLVIVASAGGSPEHPGWFLNLRNDPEVEVELGRDRQRRQARIATAEERERLWPRVVEMYPAYDAYRRRTSREIPLIVLEP